MLGHCHQQWRFSAGDADTAHSVWYRALRGTAGASPGVRISREGDLTGPVAAYLHIPSETVVSAMVLARSRCCHCRIPIALCSLSLQQFNDLKCGDKKTELRVRKLTTWRDGVPAGGSLAGGDIPMSKIIGFFVYLERLGFDVFVD